MQAGQQFNARNFNGRIAGRYLVERPSAESRMSAAQEYNTALPSGCTAWRLKNGLR
jgi:hypothetical protein